MKRILSRNHPEVDEGWLCDKGRFALPAPVRRGPRRRPAAHDRRRGASRRSPGTRRSTRPSGCCARRAAGRCRALRLGDGRAGLRAREAPPRRARRARGRAPGADGARRSTRSARRSRRSATPTSSSCRRRAGRGARADRRPLDPRGAARTAARSITVGAAGRRFQAAPGTAADARPAEQARRSSSRDAERAIADLVGPGRRTAAPRSRSSRASSARTAALPPPGDAERPRRRGGLGRRAASAGRQRARSEIGCCSSPATRRSPTRSVRALAEHAERVIAITMFAEPARGWADLVLPGTSYLERDGTNVNLEGRLQRLRRAVIPPARTSSPGSPSSPSGSASSSRPATTRAVSSEERRSCPRARPRATARPDRRLPPSRSRHGAGGRPLRLVRYRPLFSGPAVERVAGAPVPAPRRRDRALAAATRACAGSPPATTVDVRSNGTSVAAARPRSTGASSPGVVRAAEEHVARASSRRVEVKRQPSTERALVDLADQGARDHQPPDARVRVHDAARAQADRRGCSCATARTAPARSACCSRSPTWSSWSARRASPRRRRSTSSTSRRRVLGVHGARRVQRDPVGRGLADLAATTSNGEVADVPISLILIFALGSLGIYGFIVGGWASESKYSLLGSMRTCAQLVSYEVSLALSVLGVVMMAQLALPRRASSTSRSTRLWFVVPQFVGFVVFFLAGIAETNRAAVRPARGRHRARRRLPHRVLAACAGASSRWPSTST